MVLICGWWWWWVVNCVHRSVVPRIFFSWGFNKFSWGQRAERTGIRGRLLPSQRLRSFCKWVKTVLLIDCYWCIFHGTGNLAQLCQTFWISRGGDKPPKPLRYPTGRCTCYGIMPGYILHFVDRAPWTIGTEHNTVHCLWARMELRPGS
jgi:hypothetical protein